MTPSDCRDQLKHERVCVSSLAWETKLSFDELQRFLDGDDDALSQEDFARLCDRFPHDEVERSQCFRLQSHTLDAIGDHLENASIAFISESKQGGLDLASGTLVAIGDRLFVATAGHAVYQTRVLQFIGKNVGSFQADIDSQGRPTNFRGGSNLDVQHFGRSGSPDVGFFEIDPAAADSLGRKPITLDRLGKPSLEYGQWAVLYGYPKEYTRNIAEQLKTQNVPLSSITYPSPLLDPREWPPSDQLSTPFCESIDCVVRYSCDDESYSVVSRGFAHSEVTPGFGDALPKPHGVSGGGLWQYQVPDSGVWSPDRMQLIAIQGSWTCDREHLRLTQIQHWLELVQRNCPDLANEIATRLAVI